MTTLHTDLRQMSSGLRGSTLPPLRKEAAPTYRLEIFDCERGEIVGGLLDGLSRVYATYCPSALGHDKGAPQAISIQNKDSYPAVLRSDFRGRRLNLYFDDVV